LLAVRFDERPNLWVAPLKPSIVQLERVLNDLVLNDDHGRVTAKGFDVDNVFMVAELDKDSMQFQVVSRTGKRVDSGSVPLMPEPKQAEDKSRSQ